MLNCPKCHSAMKSVCSKKRDVVIEQCQSCRGYWLDKNEIFKFVKNKLDLEKYHFNGLAQTHATSMQCPRCKKPTIEQGMIPTLNIEVERCYGCEGLFLDHGELHQMVHGQTLGGYKQKSSHTSIDKHGLPDFFKRILDDDEEVFWAQKPEVRSYLFTSMQFLLPMLVLLVLSHFNLLRYPNAYFEFFVIVLIVAAAIYFNLRYRNTFYALTNKRSIISTGVFGIDFTSIDHAKVTDLYLHVSLVDRMLDCGSVRIHTASSNQFAGHLNYIKGFVGISDPYETYKLIKSLTYRKT